MGVGRKTVYEMDPCSEQNVDSILLKVAKFVATNKITFQTPNHLHHTSIFFNCLPSFGIASCVRTIDRDVPPHLARPCFVALGWALIRGLYPDLSWGLCQLGSLPNGFCSWIHCRWIRYVWSMKEIPSELEVFEWKLAKKVFYLLMKIWDSVFICHFWLWTINIVFRWQWDYFNRRCIWDHINSSMLGAGNKPGT